MTKNTKRLMVFVLLFTLLLSGASYSRTYSRNITAWFNNIQVIVDGKNMNLSNEPFIFENRVFVPIEDLADVLLMNVNYDEGEKELTINTNRNIVSEESTPIVYQKENELFYLKAQVASLTKELETLKGGKYTDAKITSVAEMEKYLNESFKKLEDISTTIKFTGLGSNKYRLSVEFYFNDMYKWNLLGRRDIELWVDDIFYAVRELYNDKAEIEGVIKHNSSIYNTDLVTYYTRVDRLYYDFTNSTLKKTQQIDGVRLEAELAQRIKNYNYLNFTYEVFVSQNNDVDVFITPSQNDFFDWTPKIKMQYLKRLKTEIEKLYPYVYVSGRVKDTKDIFKFSFNGDVISSADLLNETEDYINYHYKSFIYIDTFAFKYTLTEGYSGSYQIQLQGNFSKHDNAWDTAKTYAPYSFRTMILNAFNYVNDIWDVDIFGEVIDKNNEGICELEFYSSSPNQVRTLQPILFK